MREVPQQIACGADAEPFERFGAPLADTLEKLHRRIQPGSGPGGAGGHRI